MDHCTTTDLYIGGQCDLPDRFRCGVVRNFVQKFVENRTRRRQNKLVALLTILN